MKQRKIFFWSITVALGGFLFGYDTAVISGSEQEIQQFWGLSDFLLGQTVAMALYGTILGALLGGIPTQRLGRKRTLFGVAVLYLVSALGSALAPEVYSLMFFRFIGGIGVGASSIVAPVYITEISPKNNRGKLTGLFQFNIVFGILIAYFANYIIGSLGGDWRLMLGMETVPALAFLFLLFSVPESPRWLIMTGRSEEQARATLALVDSDNVDEIVQSVKNAPRTSSSFRLDFADRKLLLPLLMAFLFAFFNQLSGINAVIYYSPRIFTMTGMGKSIALLSSAGVGLINLIFTMLGLYLIDRAGRKRLMYIGSIGYIVSLAILAYSFFTESFNPVIVLGSTFGFIASHAVGQGACIWVFISEIFPDQSRAFGQSLGSTTHWVLAAGVSALFPFFATNYGGGAVFSFFCFMMFFQLLFVSKMMPETKGLSIEEIQAKL
ncbi:MAG: sugar porter family MFS transporter [Bacteroidota bacterium]